MLQSMGSQRGRHDLVTEQQQHIITGWNLILKETGGADVLDLTPNKEGSSLRKTLWVEVTMIKVTTVIN